MVELELPDENEPLWEYRVGVDFLVSARDMVEARTLVDRALAAEDSDGTSFVTRDYRVIKDGLPWGVADWQAVAPRPSQAALVQEHYPGLVADVAVVEGLQTLLRSEAAARLPEHTLQRLRLTLADADPEIMVEEPGAAGRRVFDGAARDAAASLAEGVYQAFDADDREYVVVVAPSELTASGRVSAAFPKQRHESRTLDELSRLLQEHTHDQPLPELMRLVSRQVETTRRAGFPSWIPLEDEPERAPTPAHVNVGAIVWSDDPEVEPTVLAHSSPVALAREVATTLYETMLDSDGFAGATEFLANHTAPEQWRSPEDVDRWLDALRETAPVPSFSIQRIPVTGAVTNMPSPGRVASAATEHADHPASEPRPASGGAPLWSYVVPVEFDVSAHTRDEARRLVDEALEGDAPAGVAVVQQRQLVLADGDVFGVLGWHHPPHQDRGATDPVRTVLAERAAELGDDFQAHGTDPAVSRPGWDATGRD